MAEHKVGIIGFGTMGQAHAEIWSQIPGVKVVGVVDIDEKKGKIVHQRYPQAHLFYNSLEMIDHTEPNIVIVATHLCDHYFPAIRALSEGCHVVCEKAFTYSLWQADELITTAESKGLKLAVHHQVAICEAFVEVQKMLNDKFIGQLNYMETVSKGRLASYELVEMAIHNLYMMYSVCGMPYSVRGIITEANGHQSNAKDAFNVRDVYPSGRDCGSGLGKNMFAFYDFPNGINGIMRLVTLPETNNEYASVTFYGSEGRLRIHESGGGRLFYHPKPHDDFLTPWEEVQKDKIWGADPYGKKAMKCFAENFINAIEKDKEPIVSGKDGRAALEMALGVYESHVKNGISICLPSAERRCHPLYIN